MTKAESGGVPALREQQQSRLEFIQEQILDKGSITVNEVVKALAVSRMTVHRDFDELHERGVLRKVRGGATSARSTSFESEPTFRSGAARIQKNAIAKLAAGLVRPGNVVMIDESTTALATIAFLKPADGLTVVTNFQLAVDELVREPSFRMIIVGGDYQPRYRATMGAMAERAIGDLHADILFASCTGLSGTGTFHQDQQIVGVKRHMLASSSRRVLLVDSSKIGEVALYRLGAVTDFTDVVVDDGATTENIDLLRSTGVGVHVAKPSVTDLQ